ncbi:hypothetical protein [Streptomyces sp. NPDC046925]|uniref:hypothetical protein n=1 Tax=Streptomyces sp. NPDC046925 TaxID=3155375 RepID=UPI0033E3FEF4
MATPSFYVFVEEDTRQFESVESTSFYLHRWHLVAGEPVDGGRAAAEARAEGLAGSHIPQCMERFLRAGGRPYRSVYRMHDGSWLVKLKYRSDELHFRVSTGELAFMEEEIEGQDPPKRPKTGLKAIFGR